VEEYRDFNWATPDPANGASGEGLAECVIAAVKKLERVGRVCDLGCGNGYLAGRLAASGYTVTGVDASSTGVKIARENYPDVEFLCSRIDERLPAVLMHTKFDLVISSDVIEHLYRPSDLLEAAAALLDSGGHLLICTPYHGYLKNLTLSVSGRMDAHFTALWDGGHIKFFSVKTLSELISRHGFTDLRFSYYGRAPYLWKNMICCARKR
jgi:2-polyprenyl-3-methyl-5-hydroxy-6-metoxy-1,4-benzoquinol methylase